MITNVHKPIMVKEISSFLNNDKELSILDCTFGGGGHTMSFLDLGHKVMAIDEDLKAQEIAKDLRKKFNNFYFLKMNFKDLEKIEKDYLKNKFDFILLDLGFSSNQLEDVQIGISFKEDSKLNMNYLNSGSTAHDIINNYSEEELSRIFADYGEIKQSLKLAKFIVSTRQGKSINTNFDLIEVLRGSGVNFRSKKIHFATQAFQALRIECNKELENLNIFLEKVYNFLNKDGILAIISFHSLEDRIVKNYFKSNSFKKDNFKNQLNWGFEILTKRPITPNQIEIKNNPRSRSSKLRVGRFVN
jgi:16S rRNA (cytosine1402-N4)-methyltransferase